MNGNVGVSWKNSIFMRIVVTFLAILMPLYLLGVYIYDAAMRIVRTEISGSMVAQVSFYMNGLEKEMQRIQLLQFDLINDVYLNKLAMIPDSMDRIQKTETILHLQRRMEAIRSSSLYISDFTVYIPSIARTITDRNVNPIDMGEYRVLDELYKARRTISYFNGAPAIIGEFPFVDDRTHMPVYILLITLDGQAFAGALNQFNKYPGSGSFLINSDTSRNIASVNISEAVEGTIIGEVRGGERDAFELKGGEGAVRGICVCSASQPLGMTLGLYVPEDVVFRPIKLYRKWFYVFTIAAAAVIALFSFSIYRLMHKPLIRLVNAFKQMEDGNLGLAIEHNHRDEFRYLYRCFNDMVKKLDMLIQQVYTQRILAQKAELKQLQSQINPHFLYNSFFILHRRIKVQDYENALVFSEQLGNYFEFITRSATDEVKLRDEVEHARIYAGMQAMRFSNRIRAEFGEPPARFADRPVPRLILQPIIENAFVHGLEDREEDGLLRVSFPESPGRLHIVVEDSGRGISDGEIESLNRTLAAHGGDVECTGVINIHRRIRLMFGEGSGVTVSRSGLGGLRVALSIEMGEGALYA